MGLAKGKPRANKKVGCSKGVGWRARHRRLWAHSQKGLQPQGGAIRAWGWAMVAMALLGSMVAGGGLGGVLLALLVRWGGPKGRAATCWAMGQRWARQIGGGVGGAATQGWGLTPRTGPLGVMLLLLMNLPVVEGVAGGAPAWLANPWDAATFLGATWGLADIRRMWLEEMWLGSKFGAKGQHSIRMATWNVGKKLGGGWTW